MKPSRCCPIAVLALLPIAAAFAAEEPSKGKPASKESRAALETDFARKMSGATLVGSFTVEGQNEGKPPESERYELGKVSKFKGDFWTFEAKIKYGKKETEAKIPITVKVLWAGETPVITVDKLTIPGMGTFDARVLVHGDRYVGTWQHGEHGGHMFGTIQRPGKRGKKASKLDDRDAVPVSGTVLFDGKPLEGATITLVPADGQGQSAKAVTDAAGRFKLNASSGRKRVTIDAGPGLLPAQYKAPSTSGLEYEVRGGVKNEFVLELQ